MHSSTVNFSIVAATFFALTFTTATNVRAQAVPLGTAGSYAVLAGATVTNAGGLGTVLNGNLGLSPGTSITGFVFNGSGAGIVNGTVNQTNGAAGQAQNDL